MAIANPTPARHVAPATHAAKAAHAGHAKNPAATDAGAAATGFSAMLGAAEDASANAAAGAAPGAAGAATPGAVRGARGARAATAAAGAVGAAAAPGAIPASNSAAAPGVAAVSGPAGTAGTPAAAGHGRKAGKGAPGTGADGNDAATLAAWNGLMQPAATALPSAMAGGAAAAGTALASTAVTGVGGVGTAIGTAAAGARSLAGPAQAVAQGAGQATPTPGLAATKALPKLTPPGTHAAAGAPGVPGAPADKAQALSAVDAHAPNALAANDAGAGAAAQPATPANPAMAPGLTADPGGVQQAAAGAQGAASQMRFGTASPQAAAGRVQASTAAADKISAQAGSLQAAGLGGMNVAMGEGDGTPMRGASPSTLSMGEGGQGRWAGMLSELARAPQSDTGAGGFGEGGSQGRGHSGADAQARGNDALGSGNLGFTPTGALGDGGFQSASSATGSSTDTQASGAAGVMTPDEWLQATTPSLNAQGVQTAELTMDAFGAPVDVRIALSGSEAQVQFQSDQASTREMLSSAVPDLQNLLQREGLVLSNVSVQGSGAQASGQAMADAGGRGDRGDRGGSGRQGRTGTAAIDSASPVSARPRPASVGSGAVDLFA